MRAFPDAAMHPGSLLLLPVLLAAAACSRPAPERERPPADATDGAPQDAGASPADAAAPRADAGGPWTGACAIEAGPTVLDATAFGQPRIVARDGGFALCWEAQPAGTIATTFVLLDSDGAPASAPVNVGGEYGVSQFCRVAAGPAGYAAASGWNSFGAEVRFAALDDAGNLLAGPIAVAGGGVPEALVATDDEWLLVVRDTKGLWAERVSSAAEVTGGPWPVSGPSAGSEWRGTTRPPDGVALLLRSSWDASARLSWVEVAPDGSSAVTTLVELSGAYGLLAEWTGDGYTAAWAAAAGVRVVRLDADGSPLGDAIESAMPWPMDAAWGGGGLGLILYDEPGKDGTPGGYSVGLARADGEPFGERLSLLVEEGSPAGWWVPSEGDAAIASDGAGRFAIAFGTPDGLSVAVVRCE